MQFGQLKRREFITLLGGGAAAWPLAARAQETVGVRRIGVLMAVPNDSVGHAQLAAFQEGLQKLGWTENRNVRMDVRWAVDATQLRTFAAELVALQLDVIVAGATSALAPLQQTTRTIPIVFAQVSDPLHGGFIENLAQPAGNVTGFALYEYGIGAKWLELLNQLAPRVNRVAVIFDPDNRSSLGQLPEIEAHATSFGVRPSAFPVRDAPEIDTPSRHLHANRMAA
jgi:putative ABC transport system substrate-binding protein